MCSHPLLYLEGIQRKLDGNNQKKRRRAIVDTDEEDCIEVHSSSSSLLPCMSDPTAAVRSTKMDFLTEDIDTYLNAPTTSKDPVRKVLVFCMWTTEMKLIARALKKLNIPALLFDGKQNRDTKENILNMFKQTSINVLILQVNCGSTGLNLQCAQRIYITSINFNPGVDMQAIGRAWRKNQLSKVTCIRLLISDTIEERCLAIQEEKMHIIAEAMDDDTMQSRLGSGQKGYSLTDKDVRSLFHKPQPIQEPPLEETQSMDIDLLQTADSTDDLIDKIIKGAMPVPPLSDLDEFDFDFHFPL